MKQNENNNNNKKIKNKVRALNSLGKFDYETAQNCEKHEHFCILLTCFIPAYIEESRRKARFCCLFGFGKS